MGRKVDSENVNRWNWLHGGTHRGVHEGDEWTRGQWKIEPVGRWIMEK